MPFLSAPGFNEIPGDSRSARKSYCIDRYTHRYTPCSPPISGYWRVRLKVPGFHLGHKTSPGTKNIWKGNQFTNLSTDDIGETQRLERETLALLRTYDRGVLSADQRISYDTLEWYLAMQVNPGYGCSHNIGRFKLSEMRQRAMDQLGEAFDIKAFHNVVLGHGVVPREILEQLVDEWIAATVTTEMETLPGEYFVSAGLPELACKGIPTNDAWTPVIREFRGVSMVLVPAGCFEMGSTDEQVDDAMRRCEELRGAGNCERSWYQDEQPAETPIPATATPRPTLSGSGGGVLAFARTCEIGW